MGQLDAEQTRLRALSFDPGSAALYRIIVAAAWASLLGVLLVTDSVKTHPGPVRWLHICLALAALGATWLLMQTVFALRYARRYCREDAHGLVYAGSSPPTYLDFAYFPAIIGMTSRAADVGIASPSMRRLLLLHGLLSFGFNLLVLALTLNLIASALE